MFKLLVVFALVQVAFGTCLYPGLSLDHGVYASYAAPAVGGLSYASYAAPAVGGLSYAAPVTTLGSDLVYPYSSLDTLGVRCARQVTQTGKNNVNAGSVGGSITNNR